MDKKKSGQASIMPPPVYKPAAPASRPVQAMRPETANGAKRLAGRTPVAFPPPAPQARGLAELLRPPVALPSGLTMQSKMAGAGPEVAQLKGSVSQVIQCVCGACGNAYHAQAACNATKQQKNAYRMQRMQGKHGGGNAHGRRRNVPAARAARQQGQALAAVAARARGKKK